MSNSPHKITDQLQDIKIKSYTSKTMLSKKPKKPNPLPSKKAKDFWRSIRSLKNLIPYNKKNKKALFLFNIAAWKRDYIRRCFPTHKIFFVSLKDEITRHHKLIQSFGNPEFFLWGINYPDSIALYAREHKIPLYHIEDGFVRSVGLGALHTLPHSICIDQSGIYYDARTPSDLEILLQNTDFSSKPELMAEAEKCLQLILEKNITKYNLPPTKLAEKLYGPKVKNRILVIGQVEDDQSILFGCKKPICNNDAVHLAAKENPNAQIIYKIHPDIIASKRRDLSNSKEIAHLATIIKDSMSLDDALTGVDRVYTITSLAGFESLIRGIPVTTLGSPFYAGWGLTDSREFNSRRTRKLSLLELFAGAYLLYPKYFNANTGKPSSLHEVINEIINTTNKYRLVLK